MRNLKRALSLAMATFMLLGMMVVGAGAVSISDFSDGEKIVNQEAVTVLTTLNVLNGRDDGTYDPEGVVTRGEMAKMICTVLNGGRTPQLGNVTTSFSDTKGHWAETFIAYCANLGIIAGYGDGSFLPNATVTAAEASKMLLVALGYKADVEGYVGANWQINVDVAANQNNLYNALGTLNTTDGLSRDNAAQMVFNALNAQMVEYKYVITGNVDNSITTKPQISSDGLGTLLVEKFNADKLEAVVVSNDTASLDNGYTTADDAGESTLVILSANGTALKDPFVDTYKVETSKDMLGQRVALYVKTNNNTVGYDADNTIVIGTPIVVARNKVVESHDGTEMGDLLKDNKLVAHEDITQYFVNYGGTYAKNDYSKTPVDMTQAEFDAVIGNKGVYVRLIDHNGDKTVDYALAEQYRYGTIDKYETADDGALRIGGSRLDDDYETAEAIGFDDVARYDFVLYAEFGGKIYIEKPETQEAKLEAYSTSKKTVKLDGETIDWSGLGGVVPSEILSVSEHLSSGTSLEGTGTWYKDQYGYVIAVGDADESALNYAVLLSFENQSSGTAGTLGKTAQAELLLSDGTVDTYKVESINGKKVSNTVIFETADRYNIYSYTLTEGGKMRLTEKTTVNDTTDKAEVSFTKNHSNIEFTDTDSADLTGDANYTITGRTVFLYEKLDGSISRFVGKGAPSINNSMHTTAVSPSAGDPLADEDIIVSVKASTNRGEALVVFLYGVAPSNDFTDNFAYVYNRNLTQNKDGYETKAIIDGEIKEIIITAALPADGSTDSDDSLINEDWYDDDNNNATPEIFGHFLTHPTKDNADGLYTYSENGDGTYVLRYMAAGNPGHDAGYMVDGRVSAVSYNAENNFIRVDGKSYSVTNDTLGFYARTGKTALDEVKVARGDDVVLVINDDDQVIYSFVTLYDYDRKDPTPFDTDYVPEINEQPAPTNTLYLDKGGVIAEVDATNDAGKGLSYQWYERTVVRATTNTALENNAIYSGVKTATLSLKPGATLSAGDHTYYCVITATDENGNTRPETTEDVVLTVKENAPVTGGLTLSLDTTSGGFASTLKVLVKNVSRDGEDYKIGNVLYFSNISVGDAVRVVDTKFVKGTYWMVGTEIIKVKTGGMLDFTMPDTDVALAVADQHVYIHAGANVTVKDTDTNGDVLVTADKPAYVLASKTIFVELATGSGDGVIVATTANAAFGTTAGGIADADDKTLAATDKDLYLTAGWEVTPAATTKTNIGGSDTTEVWSVEGATGALTAATAYYVANGEKVVSTLTFGSTGFTAVSGGATLTADPTNAVIDIKTEFDTVVTTPIDITDGVVTFAAGLYKSGVITFTWTVNGTATAAPEIAAANT